MHELREDLKSLKSTKNYSLAAKHLQKRYPDKYGKLKHDYLRKIVNRALLLDETSNSIPSAIRSASGEATADSINDLVAAIESEIENGKALEALVKRNLPD